MNLSCARVLMQHLSQSSQVHMPLPPKTSSTTTRSTTTASLRSKRFLASSSRKLGREQKKGTFFFGSRSNFRAMITRLETLATQARQQREGKTEPRFRITLLIFNFIAGCLIGFRWGTIVKKRTSDLRYKALVEESFPQVSHSPMHGNGDIFRCSKILSFIIYSELNKDHSTTLIKR